MSVAEPALPVSPAPLPPADGPWLLARVLSHLPIDGFDPDDLPEPYPLLIAAALAIPAGDRLPAVKAELAKFPAPEQHRVGAAHKAANPLAPRGLQLPRSRTAAQLLRDDLPPHRWLVEGLLVRPGLTILGGQPKVGKSWLSLQFARAIALGSHVLERPVAQAGPVLYYVLEDGPSRLQSRLRAAGWHGDEGVRFLFGDVLPPLDTGGLQVLESNIRRRRPALVVIDSLAAAKSSHLAENDGGQVAELMYGLARICSAHDLSLLVVHHHRKTMTGSPLADLRGSGALGGAADSILALYRERNSAESRLGLDSRDAAGGDWTLRFDRCAWQLVGDASLSKRVLRERSVVSALQSLGPEGAGIDEIAGSVGVRRSELLITLDALVASGQLICIEQPTAAGAGRPHRVYRLSE